MAYPNPNYYQPYYQPVYQQPQMPQQAQYSQQNQPSNQMPIQNQNQQIQNGGLVSVHNVDEARNYPVSYGTSVMFKDESQPNVIYTKTMGFNQLDTPSFTKYRLVKEEDAPQTSNLPHTDTKQEKVDNSLLEKINAKIRQIEGDIDDIWEEINNLKITKRPTAKKKEVSGDDTE